MKLRALTVLMLLAACAPHNPNKLPLSERAKLAEENYQLCLKAHSASKCENFRIISEIDKRDHYENYQGEAPRSWKSKHDGHTFTCSEKGGVIACN